MHRKDNTMTGNSLFLGIDVGTQSTKAMLYHPIQRTVVATAAAPHRILQENDGTSRQKAQWWHTAIQHCLTQLSPHLSQVAAVGVSGQQHGLVALDAQGDVLMDVPLWNDTSCAAESESLTRRLGDELLAVGNMLPPGYTAPKLYQLKHQHPSIYNALHTVLLPHDYINFLLTGERVMEYGDASGTGMLNITNRIWHKAVLTAIDSQRDLTRCLPALCEANTVVGLVTDVAATQFGLPAGIPVSTGGGDNMMAALGTGCVVDGAFTVSLGTSGTMYGFSAVPVIDPEGEVAAFCASTGGWLPLVCTMNCTVATELLRDVLTISTPEIDALTTTVPPGCNGLITIPFFSGERTPNKPHATGSIIGLTARNYTRAHLLRSAMESALYALRYGQDAFKRLQLNPQQTCLTGGGANSALWCQMTADILGCPVRTTQITESAAFGAALDALIAWQRHHGNTVTAAEVARAHVSYDAQTYTPDQTARAVYNRQYDQYLAAVQRLT